MLVVLGTLADTQTPGTAEKNSAVAQILDYCVIHPGTKLQYHASGIILRIHSNAYYLSELKSRSRSGGHFFIVSKDSHKTQETNGAILALSKK